MAEGRDVAVDLRGLRELRLRVQGLRSPFDTTAPEVVRRFVAVQAQEFLPAQWGLAARVPIERRPDAASVAAALDAGEILRTHVLRPTWHFLHPEDARWVMELSAERVHRANGTYYRRTGLEGETATRAMDVIATSLAGGHRTRAELADALEAGGVPKAGLSFAYVMIMAELERIAISGANAGKQRTYAAFDERVPPSPPRPRDEALAELAARFIASRGPATERDFASWSGFTLGDARTAFADAADPAGRGGGRIDRVDVDGTPHAFDAASVEHVEARAGCRGARRGRPAAGVRRVHHGLRAAPLVPAPRRTLGSRAPRVPAARHRRRRGDGRSVGAGRARRSAPGCGSCRGARSRPARNARSRHPSPRWSGSSASR